MKNLEQVIIKPLITEKASVMTERTNRYCFQVLVKANKYNIKSAVEKFYNVKVLDVKTNITPGKVKMVGRTAKKGPKVKKAFVRLGEGQKIEFFKGV